MQSTLLWQQSGEETEFKKFEWMISQGRFSLDFLVFNEIMKQIQVTKTEVVQPAEIMEDTPDSLESIEHHFELTQLGQGILRSGLAPEEGLLVYADLARA